MKLSLIISSYNQKNRLKYCLQSAVKQKLKYATNLEIIIADDNSEDGTDELLHQYKDDIIVVKSPHSKKEKYTLANNWSNAVTNYASGDRVIFTNGDHILASYFADNHADPVMSDDIIFGPAFQTRPEIEPFIYKPDLNYKDIIKVCSDNNLFLPDRHSEGSANTYNRTWEYWFPFGYNFSILRQQFIDVGGFPPLESWGNEESLLCKKIIDKYKNKVKSNSNSVAFHLWHPVVNEVNMYGGNTYRF